MAKAVDERSYPASEARLDGLERRAAEADAVVVVVLAAPASRAARRSAPAEKGESLLAAAVEEVAGYVRDLKCRELLPRAARRGRRRRDPDDPRRGHARARRRRDRARDGRGDPAPNRPCGPRAACNRPRAIARRPRSTCRGSSRSSTRPPTPPGSTGSRCSRPRSRSSLSAAPQGCTDSSVPGRHRRRTRTTSTPRTRTDVVAIEWAVEGEPRLFTLGHRPLALRRLERAPGSPSPATSFAERRARRDSAAAADARRRAAADARRRDRGGAHPARASSYNWVLATPEGAANVEGSATNAARPAGADVLVHANHYARAGDARATRRSRRTRARRRATAAPRSCSRAGADAAREILCDHEGGICRHGDPDGTKTVFWCVADLPRPDRWSTAAAPRVTRSRRSTRSPSETAAA